MSFTTIAVMITVNVTVVYSGVVGCKTFFPDSMSDVIPAAITNTAITMALRYSIRPCPKGCLRSAGRAEYRVPMMVTTDENTSLRLLTASITIAMEPAKNPTTALKEANSTLDKMPIRLVRIIC